jgi:hypothetical protein
MSPALCPAAQRRNPGSARIAHSSSPVAARGNLRSKVAFFFRKTTLPNIGIATWERENRTKRMETMKDLTEKTIALLRRASDFAAAAHDHNFLETEIDGERINAITLELQLRTMAGKLEYATRTRRQQPQARA